MAEICAINVFVIGECVRCKWLNSILRAFLIEEQKIVKKVASVKAMQKKEEKKSTKKSAKKTTKKTGKK